MRKILQRFGAAGIVDETNGFVKKTASRFWSTTSDMGAVPKRRTDLGPVHC